MPPACAEVAPPHEQEAIGVDAAKTTVTTKNNLAVAVDPEQLGRATSWGTGRDNVRNTRSSHRSQRECRSAR